MRTGNPSFWIIRAYFLAASRESSSLFAPVQTIFPLLNIKAVVLGSRILIITAANRFGLYSAFLAWSAIFFKSNLQFKLTVDTIFLKMKKIFNIRDKYKHKKILRWNKFLMEKKNYFCNSNDCNEEEKNPLKLWKNSWIRGSGSHWSHWSRGRGSYRGRCHLICWLHDRRHHILLQ